MPKNGHEKGAGNIVTVGHEIVTTSPSPGTTLLNPAVVRALWWESLSHLLLLKRPVSESFPASQLTDTFIIMCLGELLHVSNVAIRNVQVLLANSSDQDAKMCLSKSSEARKSWHVMTIMIDFNVSIIKDLNFKKAPSIFGGPLKYQVIGNAVKLYQCCQANFRAFT